MGVFITRALPCLAEALHWSSAELEAFVDELMEQPLPLMHFFERMRRVDRKTGTACVPWVVVQPGETKAGVRFVSDRSQRDATVHSEPKPPMINTMLSDWGPLVKSAIRGRDFVLMDKNGNVLASVSIEP